MDKSQAETEVTTQPQEQQEENTSVTEKYGKPKTSSELLAEIQSQENGEDDQEEERQEDKQEEQEEDQEEDKEGDSEKEEDKEPEEEDEKELGAEDLFEEEKSQAQDDDDDEDLDEDTKKVVDKRVNRLVGDKLKEVDVMKRDLSFAKFLSSKEGEIYRPFENEIKKWIHDPKLAGFKLEAIANMVAGRRLIKLGADRYKAALDKSQRTKTGGNNPRKATDNKGSMPDVSGMNSADVQALAESVKRGNFR